MPKDAKPIPQTNQTLSKTNCAAYHAYNWFAFVKHSTTIYPPAAVERRRLKRVEKLALVPMVKEVGVGGGEEGGKRVAIFEYNPPPLVQLLVLNFQQQQRAIVDVLH
ncbi:DEAD box helicase [Trichinella spiralis]|uniref:DEAD box helicase n=1 Tax=Trichinella spiralis TaxID=6334 RepID=UPI0001EFDB8F|nr:DEAD box helicase [Trichinella spiralis]